MRKEKINISTIIIILMLVWLLVPVANSVFNKIGLSLSILSVLSVMCCIVSFISSNRLRRFPICVLGQIVVLIIWGTLSTYVYDNIFIIGNEYKNWGIININSYAAFFPSLILMLLPTICTVSFVVPEFKSTKKIERLFFVLFVINFFIQIRAISVYPDAVRSPNITRELGYGNLLKGLVGYAEIYSIALLTPCIFQRCFKSSGRKKIFPIILLIITLIMTLTSNLATAGIIAVLGVCLCAFFNSRGRKKIIIGIIIFFGVILMSFSLDTILEGFSHILGIDTAWGRKFSNLSVLLSGAGVTGDVKGRTELYISSLESFKTSPVFGALTNPDCIVGEHSTVFDILATLGLFGLVLYGAFVYFSYKMCQKTTFFKNNSAVVKATYIQFIIMIIFKNTITSYAIYGTMFVALPLYYHIYSDENFNYNTIENFR